MRPHPLKATLAAAMLAIPAGIAFADEPPKLNVSPSCEAAARGAVALGRNKEACMSDENAALQALKQGWSKFSAADKTQCVGNVQTGGPASYVELLSCLEIMRDAKSIRQDDTSLGSGTSTSSTERPPSRRRRPRNY